MKATFHFHVLIKPFGPVCNLSCDYCYYLGKKDLFPKQEQFRMTEETLDLFTRQYIEAQPPGTTEVNFAWQGGEPTLMGIDFYKRAITLQKRYFRPGMQISNAIQTNGIHLDDEWGQFLHDNQFLVGISIDGPEELHDHYRKDRHGQGSFRKVMHGIELLKRHSCQWNTLTVIHKYNSHHPEKIYRFLKRVGSTFLQFIPLIEKQNSGGVTDRSVVPYAFGRFLFDVFRLWLRRDIGSIFVQQFDVLLGMIMKEPISSLCVYARSCGQNTILEHNGDLFSCDHFVFQEHRLGNIMKIPLIKMMDSEKQKSFGNSKHNSLPENCKECGYLSMCHGGCPAHRNVFVNNNVPGLNYLCDGYKYFLKGALPKFQAMARALDAYKPASEYKHFMPTQRKK